MESKDTLTINGGEIYIDAYDDCINATNHIQINGGTIYCYSPMDDAMDSNGTITVTGGTYVGSGFSSHPPQSGFDCDDFTFKVTGGTMLGLGSENSFPTENVTTQYVIAYGADRGNEGDVIHIVSEEGAVVMSYTLVRDCSPLALLFSSPDFEANTNYSIYSGGSVSGGNDYYGLNLDGTYSGGRVVGTFTTNQRVSSVGTFIGGGGGGPHPVR